MGAGITFRGRSFASEVAFVEWVHRRVEEGDVDESLAVELLDQDIVAAKVTVLEALRAPKEWALPMLRDMSRDPNAFPYGTRGALPSALGTFGDRAESELLHISATAQDPEDRLVSLDALGYVGKSRALIDLKTLRLLSLNDGDRHEIDRAIDRIEARLRLNGEPEAYPPPTRFGALRFQRRIEQMVRAHGFARTRAACLERQSQNAIQRVVVHTEPDHANGLATLDLQITTLPAGRVAGEEREPRTASLHELWSGAASGWVVNEADRDSLNQLLDQITTAFECEGFAFLEASS